MLSFEAEGSWREYPLQDLDRLLQPLDPDPAGVKRNAGLLVLGPIPARTNSDLQPPPPGLAEPGRVLGYHARVRRAVVEAKGPIPNPPGGRAIQDNVGRGGTGMGRAAGK